MQKNKNLVEEAFIQMKNVEEAIAENAKGILASTMKEEISQLVKESLSEQDDEIEMDTELDMDSGDEIEMDLDMDMDSEDEIDMEVDNDDMDMDFDMDFDSDIEPIDLTDASDDELLKVFKSMGDEDGIIVKKDGEDIHLTDNDTDSEYILKVNESEEEYESEMSEEVDDSEIDAVIDKIFSESEHEDEDEEEEEEDEKENVDEDVLYEIEFDDEYESFDDEPLDFDEIERMLARLPENKWLRDELELDHVHESKKGKGVSGKGPKFSYKKERGGFNEKMKEGDKMKGTGKPSKFKYKKGENMEGSMEEVKKSETKEAARTLGSGRKFRKGGLPKPRSHSKFNSAIKTESINEEVKMLREKNGEYRKALNVFRTKLNEVAVFNSNLAYATRLFTEHSTTKKEKINILRRFDNVETLKESKNLYKTIKEELSKGENKPINESVESKINKEVSTGSSLNLIESKTYENPQFLRMKDLMSKIR